MYLGFFLSISVTLIVEEVNANWKIPPSTCIIACELRRISSCRFSPQKNNICEVRMRSQAMCIKDRVLKICSKKNTKFLPECCYILFCNHLLHKVDSRHTSLPLLNPQSFRLSNTLSIPRQMTSCHNRPRTC